MPQPPPRHPPLIRSPQPRFEPREGPFRATPPPPGDDVWGGGRDGGDGRNRRGRGSTGRLPLAARRHRDRPGQHRLRQLRVLRGGEHLGDGHRPVGCRDHPGVHLHQLRRPRQGRPAHRPGGHDRPGGSAGGVLGRLHDGQRRHLGQDRGRLPQLLRGRDRPAGRHVPHRAGDRAGRAGQQRRARPPARCRRRLSDQLVLLPDRLGRRGPFRALQAAGHRLGPRPRHPDRGGDPQPGDRPGGGARRPGTSRPRADRSDARAHHAGTDPHDGADPHADHPRAGRRDAPTDDHRGPPGLHQRGRLGRLRVRRGLQRHGPPGLLLRLRAALPLPAGGPDQLLGRRLALHPHRPGRRPGRDPRAVDQERPQRHPDRRGLQRRLRHVPDPRHRPRRGVLRRHGQRQPAWPGDHHAHRREPEHGVLQPRRSQGRGGQQGPAVRPRPRQPRPSGAHRTGGPDPGHRHPGSGARRPRRLPRGHLRPAGHRPHATGVLPRPGSHRPGLRHRRPPDPLGDALPQGQLGRGLPGDQPHLRRQRRICPRCQCHRPDRQALVRLLPRRLRRHQHHHDAHPPHRRRGGGHLPRATQRHRGPVPLGHHDGGRRRGHLPLPGRARHRRHARHHAGCPRGGAGLRLRGGGRQHLLQERRAHRHRGAAHLRRRHLLRLRDHLHPRPPDLGDAGAAPHPERLRGHQGRAGHRPGREQRRLPDQEPPPGPARRTHPAPSSPCPTTRSPLAPRAGTPGWSPTATTPSGRPPAPTR